MKTVVVNIAGQEYHLRAEDETRVRQVADTVDSAMREFRHRSREQSTLALSVLTSLNLAEKELEAREQHAVDIGYLRKEFAKMNDFLQKLSDKNH